MPRHQPSGAGGSSHRLVVGVLYNARIDGDVPIRAWLGDHLSRAFEVLVYGRLWDLPVEFMSSPFPGSCWRVPFGPASPSRFNSFR
jgi:hypothetical protein